jgi:hypothetical protein
MPGVHRQTYVGFRDADSEIEQAFVYAEKYKVGDPISDADLRHWQTLVDSRLVWTSIEMGVVAALLIRAGRITRARRSYTGDMFRPIPRQQE